MASEIKVDTISEKTSANGVVIDSVTLKDSKVTANGGLVADNITIDGTEIDLSSGDLTLDVAGDIILDADGDDLIFAAAGTNLLKVTNSSSDVVFQPQVDTKDIVFKQYDGTVVATVEDNATFNIPASKLAIGGTAVTSTAAEMNLLDGGTSVGSSITLADADGFIVNDGGTMKTIPASDISTYAGGAWTHIVTKTASSSANISFVDGASSVVFDSTYKMYCIIGQSIVSASNNVELNLYTSNDGGSNYETSYDENDTRGISSGTSIHISNSTSVIGHVGSFGNASGKNASIIVWCPSPSESGTFHTVYGDSIVNDDQGYVRRGMFAGMHETAEAYDAIKFEMSSGNIASGTFSLYGLTT